MNDEAAEILNKILAEIQGLREEISLNNAIKRKNGHKRRLRYNNFESWAVNQRRFNARIIINKFYISKPTALLWMKLFISNNSNFILSTGRGQDPHRVVRKN